MQNEPRSRLTEDSETWPCTIHYENGDGSTRAPDYHADYPWKHWSYSMTDTNHHGFHARRKAGEIISSSAICDKTDDLWSVFPWSSLELNADYTRRYYTHGTMSAWGPMVGSTGSYSEPAMLWPSEDTIATVTADAVRDCEGNLGKSMVDLGQALAEYKQTVSLFCDAALTTWRLTRAATNARRRATNIARQTIASRHGIKLAKVSRDLGRLTARYGKTLRRSRTYIKAAKTASNCWLQYRYGIVPLISDITGLIDALNAHLEPRLTARARCTVCDDDSSESTFNAVWTEMDAQRYTLRNYTLSAGAGILYTFKSNLLQRISHFGANDLFKLGWELTPYSFVVDWFISVGDWLDALAPHMGVRRLASWVTTRVEAILSVESQLVANASYLPPSRFIVEGGGVFTKRRVWWSRTPAPPLSWVGQSSVLDVELSVKRLIDSVALLFQLRR